MPNFRYDLKFSWHLWLVLFYLSCVSFLFIISIYLWCIYFIRPVLQCKLFYCCMQFDLNTWLEFYMSLYMQFVILHHRLKWSSVLNICLSASFCMCDNWKPNVFHVGFCCSLPWKDQFCNVRIYEYIKSFERWPEEL